MFHTIDYLGKNAYNRYLKHIELVYANLKKMQYFFEAFLLDDINKKTDSTINTKPYASAIEMVDALYSGEVKAMILNTSYVSVITDTEGYEDFETKTKNHSLLTNNIY